MSDPDVIADRYRLGAVLGRGGMAQVREGLDLRLQRPIAVKQLLPALAGDPISQQRFRREAHAVAILHHPHIAAVYDTGEAPDPTSAQPVPYIVMELVEGPTLRQMLRDGGRLELEPALRYASQILDALDHSHSSGVVHRDIKPANIMITGSDQVKVMDFGIARSTDDAAGLTQTFSVIGTAQYLSPEQARGEVVDHRTDIYSTGCLLYELLTGQPPFTGDSPISIAYQHVREAPVPPSQRNPLLSADVDTVVLRALAKDAVDRYQTAAAMRDDVGRLLAGLPPAASDAPGQNETTALRPTAALMPAPHLQTQDPVTAPTFAPVAARAVVPVPAPLPPADSDEPEEKRRTGLWVLLIAAVVILLASLSFAAYRAVDGPTTTAATTVAVPDVGGQDKAGAQAALTEAGLRAQFVNAEGADDDTVDTVVGQDPGSGSQVAAGSIVLVTINGGPDASGKTAKPVGPTPSETTSSAPTADATSKAPKKSKTPKAPATEKTTKKPSDDPTESESATKKPSESPTESTSKPSESTTSSRASSTPKAGKAKKTKAAPAATKGPKAVKATAAKAPKSP